MIIDAGATASWSSNGVTKMPEMPVDAFLSFGSMATVACLFAS
jgi:hypothetical protein